MLDQGWSFKTAEGSSGDTLNNFDYMHEVYTANKPDYSGRVTVPVLWDKQKNCIVSNESSEIIRMLNSAFNQITGNNDDYHPDELHTEIDEINELVYTNINNGVYRSGFATTQKAYEDAYTKLFNALNSINTTLETNRYLLGARITEADWRLFTTLIRFDAVYYGHFKCNKRRIEDYPAISNYVRELFQWQGVASTVDMHHIKRHYYYSHTSINPTRIVPVGPELNFSAGHNRTSAGETAI